MKKLLAFTLIPYSLLLTPLKAQVTVMLNSSGSNFSLAEGSLTPSVYGNMLYAMSSTGGGGNNYGNIFSLDTSGSGYNQLLVFNGTSSPQGEYPSGSLTLWGNKLFGMTKVGGINNDGCVFSVNTDGSGYKDLFDFDGTNGTSPNGSLIIAGPQLFGMTQTDIFSIDTNGTAFKQVLIFNGPNGQTPQGDLIISGYKLFGMTQAGGANYKGCIFSIDTNGNGYKDLFDFNGTTGSNPYGSPTLCANKLFGCANGGAYTDGCIFSIDTNGDNYKDLHDFNGTDGIYTYGALTLAGNKMYGMEEEGGVHDVGVVFSIDTNGTGFTDVFSFNGTNGASPKGSLTLIGKTFFGITYSGGTSNYGAIFKFDTDYVENSIQQLSGGNEQLSVYPNPSCGIFTIQLSVAETQNFASVHASVEVYDVLGEKVFSNYQIIKSSDYQIDLRSKSDGVYFYRVLDENSGMLGEGKMVIQK